MNLISLPKRLNSIADVNKALQDLEKVLNELLTSTNTPAEGDVSDTDGKTGDIRITQNEDKDYIFEVRAEDGWKTPVIGDSAVKFKEKPSASSKKQKKSIDELDAEDASTGGAEAQKTIYDEKADKFVMARADYDSGWVDLTDEDTTGTHTLEVIPTMSTFYITNDNGVTIQQGLMQQASHNSALQMTSTTWSLLGNNDYGYWAEGSDSQTAVVYTGYKIRVLLWK